MMVEGPGCKVKGEIMRKRVKGKVVQNFKLPAKTDEAGKENTSPYLALCGLKVLDVRTLGKELFIFLDQSSVCIRIHFLMDGSVRYTDLKETSLESEQSLVIIFPDVTLTVFKSCVGLRPSEESSQHCDSMADLDICSSNFNFKQAQDKIQEIHSEIIADAIMDQTVLPGVGNIIKNEGLFRSGINPNTLVRNLSPNLIICLLHRLRDFSSVFYMCRKNNKPLKCHLSVYEKSKCTQCGNQLTVCKPGSLARLTFFCSTCQVNSNSSNTVSFPKKNSLLGFLQLSENSQQCNDTWDCLQCTYINKVPSLVCSMCFSEISDTRKRKLSDNCHPSGAPLKREKTEAKPSDCSVSKSEDYPTSKSIPSCPGHQKNCFMRTVHRSGENKGRLFYSCSVRGDGQCKFFQWADLHHPVCKHKKQTIVRRVLKQNENNGKEFYCCPHPKSHQCDFFQWVSEK